MLAISDASAHRPEPSPIFCPSGMTLSRVIQSEADVSAPWLAQVLGCGVDSFRITAGHGNWSHQWAIQADMSDGTTRALRLKICRGNTFGRSEVDYYGRDYVGLLDAPLVRCFDAHYDPTEGYHLLLEDLSKNHADRRNQAPTLSHGLAVAAALARLHRHHWESMPAPSHSQLNRYFDELRPGLVPMEQATGQAVRARFEAHEQTLRQRWADPRGMTLLHGDLNPTNILGPLVGDASLYFLDRQPFEWSLTYGLAVHDLAYCVVPWWPETARQAWAAPVLRHWFVTLNAPGYAWQQAQEDWALSVEQCLHVPIEWCSKPDTLHSMRWLWERQFARIQQALVQQDRAA
jgi:hypothetical protein